MAKQQRPFTRKSKKRKINKVYLIATEGEKTEEIYFNIFKNPEYRKNVQIKILRTKKGDSSPQAVLKRLQNEANKKNLDPKLGDELWVVIDHDAIHPDGHTKEQLQEIIDQCNKRENYFCAISNPSFELWLLLHQETPKTPPQTKLCEKELTKLLEKEYDKGNYDVSKLKPHIQDAINHAKKLDINELPTQTGTGVYRLVEKLIEN
ncbi:putative abortive phage resistance protein [Halothece sp. PCC 7418]|uniref:RloB family protein n=1 Tax=Halothece sp. (strain PCC 7418) TaxID=65093 RepID=UPI0002A067EF|nr:RloB family protein [Halothece sp. PCC 7418]AFZ44275.1 putative abortive phage resistance protein [Halothece sp. PCC 7418]